VSALSSSSGNIVLPAGVIQGLDGMQRRCFEYIKEPMVDKFDGETNANEG